MSNPQGPATRARTETQGLRMRQKQSNRELTLSDSEKKLARILKKNLTARGKSAFDEVMKNGGLNLKTVGALVLANIVELGDMDIADRSKVTTMAKFLDLGRRVADRLDTGSPSIPDAVSLELVTAEPVDLSSDLPEVEGS